MTEEEKKKLLNGFSKPETDTEAEDYWTKERLIAAAKRIIKRLNLKGELQ